jgi:hypothetical protein
VIYVDEDGKPRKQGYYDGSNRPFLEMADIGNPAGFDIATVMAGSGLNLLLSAGIMRYGDRFPYTTAELYGASGGVLIVLGVLFGIILILAGYR